MRAFFNGEFVSCKDGTLVGLGKSALCKAKKLKRKVREALLFSAIQLDEMFREHLLLRFDGGRPGKVIQPGAILIITRAIGPFEITMCFTNSHSIVKDFGFFCPRTYRRSSIILLDSLFSGEGLEIHDVSDFFDNDIESNCKFEEILLVSLRSVCLDLASKNGYNELIPQVDAYSRIEERIGVLDDVLLLRRKEALALKNNITSKDFDSIEFCGTSVSAPRDYHDDLAFAKFSRATIHCQSIIHHSINIYECRILQEILNIGMVNKSTDRVI